MRNIAEKFPEFPWVKEADFFLKNVRKKQHSISLQMRERKVRRTEIKHLLFPGGLKIENGKFIIVFNYMATEEDRIQTLGHELGHTFHYDISGDEPRLLCPEAETSEVVFDRVELFCIIFSMEWRKLNSHDEIIAIVTDPNPHNFI